MDNRTVRATQSTPLVRQRGCLAEKPTPSRSSKGLRLLSVSFCRKLRLLGFATYARIADELVEEFLGSDVVQGQTLEQTSAANLEGILHEVSPARKDRLACVVAHEASPLRNGRTIASPRYGEDGYTDERNCAERTLRRRIYDIFNVLLATGTIEKGENGSVHWRGIPGERTDPRYTEIRRLRLRVEELRASIQTKQEIARDLAEQQAAFMNLITRNSQEKSCETLDKDIRPDGLPSHKRFPAGNGASAFGQEETTSLDQNHEAQHELMESELHAGYTLWDENSNTSGTKRVRALRLSENRMVPEDASVSKGTDGIRVQYPFVVLRTGVKANIGLETNETRSSLTLGMSEPFSVFSDGDSVTLLKLHERGPYSTNQMLRISRESAARNISLRTASV